MVGDSSHLRPGLVDELGWKGHDLIEVAHGAPHGVDSTERRVNAPVAEGLASRPLILLR